MVNDVLKKIGFVIRRHYREHDALVTLKPRQKPVGNVLLSYIIDPFFVSDPKEISNSHHHDWLSWQIAQTFLDLGYTVDAIDYRNYTFRPKKKYKYFIGARTNFQRITNLLNADCYKIVHLDTAHWLVSNHATYKRCLSIQQRRGVTLESKRIIENNWAIECADIATTNLGNQFNVSTYAYAGKPIYQIPLPTCTVYPWYEKKDFSTCKRNFLWFGSGGLVHKGLDLVLEAFADMPDCHLTICGPVKGASQPLRGNTTYVEKDFEKEYHKELYETPNIHAVGWVDIESQKFIDILNSCVSIVFPSCSEGGAASVITCMQAGLIPCVSFESSVQTGNFGITLATSSIDEIKEAVYSIVASRADDLARRARKTWEFSRIYHTKDFFTKEYEYFVNTIQTSPEEATRHNLSAIEKYRQWQ